MNGVVVTQNQNQPQTFQQTQTYQQETAKETLKKAAEEYLMFHLPKEVTEEQRKFLIALCAHLGLDPFKREIHFIPYQEYRYDEKLKRKIPTGRIKVEAVVSYLVYVKRALMTGKLKGWSVKIEKAEDDSLKAVCTIHRSDFQHPFTWEVFLNEAKRNTTIWQEMPLFMLKKVCIAQAFRLAFPEITGELPYTEEEITGFKLTEQEQLPIQTQEEPKALEQKSSETANFQSSAQVAAQETQEAQEPQKETPQPSQSQSEQSSQPQEAPKPVNLRKLF
jgi:phage recombination protein Bet